MIGNNGFLRDDNSSAMVIIDFAHHEIHEGDHYHLNYSVANIGAATTPTDMMTLSFNTPNTAKRINFIFGADGPAGSRVRLIEGKTGGATGSTGQLTIYNNNRNSANVSSLTSITGISNQMDYDASLATGGTTLIDEYITGAVGPRTGSGGTRAEAEFMLKQNTFYQLSLSATATSPASLSVSFYEHTPAR